ncbi:sugar phosphate isomerase/epimerase family protein [Actinacidiphila bryophytorum]|uniref:Sugar phosphate isomerase/epimerase n=1 Tax=Actinacidiphila bryophytorum TaxID=1436133 RepID=A0A9W4GXZ7_9ACTN|nr:sugar phosphate isomerase/epimerase family protein [Actinacidiphila bryophytorum]MBM9434413.1 sugar phosphate isomerase/epimerase [Actinacidiphila bryophytorum]MBN6543337.1 sugar phosphate isomerase/epimerase [Actinacidiphila bryophytorum]CAG7625766.1 Sugar phosphate isomerase/epimerase [Actinacidiphila bryophytorum]
MTGIEPQEPHEPHEPKEPHDLTRLSINQETVKQWSLPELAAGCTAAGIGSVGLWRAPVQEYGVERAARLMRDSGLTVTSLCRGGFFTARDPELRARALDDNRAAIDEAAELATGTLVLVSGGLPAADRDIAAARERVADALAELAPYAAERGVRLALEPLHPMYASDRCVISTLGQALDIAERFPAEQVGVVVDTYHLWWDDLAPAHTARAGAGGRIAAFQLADWVTPLPEGVLLGRGQLGDGCIDLRGWHRRVDAAGYRGAVEVEIFNPALWARDGAEVLAEVAERYVRHAL